MYKFSGKIYVSLPVSRDMYAEATTERSIRPQECELLSARVSIRVAAMLCCDWRDVYSLTQLYGGTRGLSGYRSYVSIFKTFLEQQSCVLTQIYLLSAE